MKTQLHIAVRVSAFVALLAALCALPATASEREMKTTFTINQPVLIPGKVVLPAGTYVIKRVDVANPPLVRVTDPTETKIYATLFGIPEYLMNASEEPRLTFNETPKGTLHSLRGWYYPGSGVGIEFPTPQGQSSEFLARAN